MNWKVLFEIELFIIIGAVLSLGWYCWVCWLWHGSKAQNQKPKKYLSNRIEDDPDFWEI